MVHQDREGRHAFSPAGVAGLLLAGMICGIFWREVAQLVLALH